jgi:hypothetical protein
MKKKIGCLYELKNARDIIRSELGKKSTVQRQNATGTIHVANKNWRSSGFDNLVNLEEVTMPQGCNPT